MLLGALTVLLTGQLFPYDGLKSINLDVMTFLFGMFVIGEAIHRMAFFFIYPTIVILCLARSQSISPKLLLLSLAFGVNLGKRHEPYGNSQNLLIDLNGDFANPFHTFIKYLIPTMVNLFLAYLRLFYKGQFQDCRPLNQVQQPVEDSRLALISETSFILLIIIVVVKIAMVLMGYGALSG